MREAKLVLEEERKSIFICESLRGNDDVLLKTVWTVFSNRSAER